ncbi:unnamed protein product [Fusarium venenatum]|uniref:Uncharacterized protein n=1 Tax=Fusarium venenatum TaxID=56646 RepID=A0A2L2TK27_9HYPO|nr:uncharacterized protein FVRRES_05066 [Fusarium venenatum]CEI60630.1 unnamed protein product [Fusarium venenatum]
MLSILLSTILDINHKKTHRLVNLKDVSSLLLKLLNLLAGINLLAGSLGLVGNSLLENLGHVRYRPGRTTQVEAAFILNVGLGNLLESLAHTVLDVDLLRLVTREGRTDESDNTGSQVGLPFLTIEVLLTLVTRTKVQKDGTDLLALSLLHSTVLDKGTEGSETRSETSHDKRSSVLGRQLHDGRLDRGSDLGADRQTAEVMGSMSVSGAATRVNPVDNDNHQRHRVGGDSLGRGDRVLSALRGADNLDKLLEAGASRLELLKDIDVGSGVNLGTTLQFLGTSRTGKSLKLLLLSLISGKLSKGLIEALGRLAKNINVLNESLEDGTGLEKARILTSRNLDQLGRVNAVELDELADFLLVILSVDAQSLTDLVSKTRVAEIELNVEDVAVIILRSETAVLLNSDGGSLDSQLGSQNVLGAISLLESEGLGSGLPVTELECLLSLLLAVDNEAVGLDGGGKVGVSKVSIDLGPGGRDLERAEAETDSIDGLLQSRRMTLGEDVLGNLLRGVVRKSNLQERQLKEELGEERILLKSRRVGRVKDEKLSGLLLETLSESNRKTLLNLIVLEVGQLDNDLAAISQTLEDIDLLENVLIANNDGIGIVNVVRSLESLLGGSQITADNTTLGKVVEDLVDIDVRGRLLGEEAADHTRGVESGRAVEVPEGELLSLDERRQLLGLAIVVEDLTLRSERLSRGVLDVKNLRLVGKLAGESNSGQNIAVESRLGSLVFDSKLILDLAKNGDGAGRGRDSVEESLLNERSVDSDIDHANLGSINGELGQDLLGDLRLDAAKGNENDIRRLVAVVLERLVNGAELIVEKLEKLDNFTGSVKAGVELASLSRELAVQVSNTVLAQSINNTKSLAGNADTIVDVKSGKESSQESRKDGHMLSLIGRGAGNKTKAKVLSKAKSNIVVGDQSLAVRVVESGNVGNKGAGDAIEEGELVESAAKLLKAARGSNQRLGDVALGDIEVGREDVTQGERTSTDSGLEGQNLSGVSVDVLLVLGGPLLECDIEVEGLGRVREDLVGQLVCDLLDKKLGSHICRTGDGRKRNLLAKGEARRQLGEVSRVGLGHGGRLLVRHLEGKSPVS